VFFDPNEIVQHLVGLKDVRVLSYARRGPAGEITIEQRAHAVIWKKCKPEAGTLAHLIEFLSASVDRLGHPEQNDC
jgi:hypothetical protein